MRASITLGLVLLLSSASACAGDDGGDGTTGGETSGDASSSSSTTAGSGDASPIYGPCDEICSLDLDNGCVSPSDGSGREFCTQPCADASECPPPPSGAAVAGCVDPGQGKICFLDCSGGAACPAGMSCSLVATAEGSRSVCFVDP